MEKGMDKKFVIHLLHESCCLTLASGIKECKWDKEKQSITTAAQAEEDACLQEMENAAWYKDEFGQHMVDKVKKSKSYADAKALYTLDRGCSVKTLHACNDPKPSAPKKRKGEEIKVGNALDLDLSSPSSVDSAPEDDVSMDSASISKNDMPNGKDEAGKGIAPRVQFTCLTTTSVLMLLLPCLWRGADGWHQQPPSSTDTLNSCESVRRIGNNRQQRNQR